MSAPILVVGSSNTDMVVKVSRLPGRGETVLGGDFLMSAGGKGANQAVAAARLGAPVWLIARVGEDLFGRQTRANLEASGVDLTWLITDPEAPSGVALIWVDRQGENSIAVAPGANSRLEPADLYRASAILPKVDWALMQLEIPGETVRAAVGWLHASGKRVILNPAPVQELDTALLDKVSLLTPNRQEAGALSGIAVEDVSSAFAAADRLRALGARQVIITLGADGALICTDEWREVVPAPKVQAVDTTAAGDTFNGALAVALNEGQTLPQAVAFANRAAAISVTRLGAQASIPWRNELA